MSQKFIVNYIFTFIIFVYLLNIVPHSVVTNTLSVLFLLFTIFYNYKLFKQKIRIPFFFYLSIAFLLLNIISWYNSAKNIAAPEYVRNSTELLLPIMRFSLTSGMFYYLFFNEIIGKKKLKKILSIFWLSSFILITYKISNGESYTNYGYLFACSTPLISLFWDNKKKLLFILCLFFIAVLLCTKRGAIICVLVGFLCYLKYNQQEKTKIFGIISNIGVLLIIGAIVYLFLNSNVLLQEKIIRMQEGDSSGRNNIYELLWTYWLSGSQTEKMFGVSFMGAAQFNDGLDAHNDWLEILLSIGVIGAAIYLLMILYCVYYMFVNRKILLQSQKYTLVSSVLIWILITMFSMGYTVATSMLLTIGLSYTISKCERLKIQLKK